MNWEKHFRAMKPRSTVSFGADADFGEGLIHMLDSNVDNLKAINDYFHRTPAKTPQASKLQSEWSQWWVTTGNPDNYTFSVPDEVYDEARNRRLAFNTANAVTPEEKETVKRVATTGLSSEEIKGQTDRRDPTTGQIFVPPPPPFNLPTWFWPVVVGGVAIVVVGPFVRKLILPV